MNYSLSKGGVTLLIVAALCATSLAQQTFTIPNGTPSVDSAGDPDNTIVSITATGSSYLLNSNMIMNSGDLTEVNTGTFASEARILIRNSAYPGLTATLQPFTTGSYTGTISLVPATSRPITGTLVGQNINPGSTWTFEFFESFNDDQNLPESTWNNLSFSSTVLTPPTPPSNEDLGTLALGATSITRTFATNEVKWFKITLPAAVSANRYLDIDNDMGASPTVTNNDTSMGLYNSVGVLVTSDTADGLFNGAMLSYGTLPAYGSHDARSLGAALSDQRDGALAAGTYYLAVAPGNATFAAAFTVTAPTGGFAGDIPIRFFHNDFVAPGTLPSSFEDLGTISGDTSITRTFSGVAGKWFKISLPGGVTNPAEYLDIDTEDTTAFLPPAYTGNTSTSADTEIGLYRADGTLVVSDDDDGSSLLSQLSFGDTTSRGTLITGANSASADRNGRDGDLPAGDYYLYVGGFNVNYFTTNSWTSTNNAREGDITIHFRSNISGGGGSTVSGVVTLNNSDADWSNETVTIEVVDPFTSSTVESLSATLDAVGNYSAASTLTSGTYDVYIKGDTFLRKLTSGVSFGPSGAVVNATLTNGDVDGDNEIAPNDFSILSGAFGNVDGDPGYSAAADLDDDGEVGPNDFSILAANFGQSGD